MAETTGNDRGWRGSRWRLAMWGAAALLLLLPLLAMQFTTEVAWGPGDFIVFGALLACACGTCEVAARATSNRAYRAAVGIAIATAFLLVWINLAVGIVGDEGNPANLMFAGVLAVGIIGAVLARFTPRGMARALVATAFAQALVGAIALLAGWSHASILATIFAALWLASAHLFRTAAHQYPRPDTMPQA